MSARFSSPATRIRQTALAVSFAGSLLGTAHAWAEPVGYSIPAGSLAHALDQFADASGAVISFSHEEVAGLHSKGLHGNYALHQALAELLQGSGLQVQAAGDKHFMLVSAEQDGAMELAATTVSSMALGATTEGTGSYTTGSVNTATGLRLSARETPQSVSVVTRQQIEDQNLNDVTQVLEQTPGVVVDSMGPAGSDANHIYVRGFEVGSIQVDGINRPDTFGFRDDLSDMVSYDRVEVVRGATGLMSGTGDPGATVNLIRKKPTLETQRKLTLKAGSWDNYRTELDVSGKLTQSGNVRGRFVASNTDSQSYVDRQSLERQVAYGVLEWDITDSTMLTAGAEYQEMDNDGAGNHGFPMFNSDGSHFSPSRAFNSASDWSYHKRRTKTVFTTLEHQLDNGWQLKLNAEHSRRSYDDAFATAASGTVKPDGSGISTWTGRWAGEPRQTSFDLSASGPFELLSREHQAYLGASHYRAYYRNNGYPLWTIQTIDNIYTWDGSLAIPDAIHAKSSEDALDETQDGLVASVRWSLADDLSLITGARLIDWKRDETSTTLSSGATSRTSRSETGVVTPYLGLVYDLNEHWSAYASYTTIFKPQSNKDINGTYLDPLEGVNYELGLKSEFWDQRLTTAFSVFEVHQDNLAVADGSNLAPDGNQAYRAESGTKTRGFEMEMAGEILPDWQVSASYTYAVSKDSDGDRLNTEIPRDTLKLFTSYRLATLPQLKVGGGVRWQGTEYYKSAGPNNETFTQDPYSVVDLMAQYAFTPQTSVSLNLNNVLDKTYYTAIGARGWYGSPRSATATLVYAF
ncbi:ligand-gated channel protein [Pseudomonas putida JB]|jgi:outer membrane receptor for ferric coprogen and ferric-rhodotorulic acid|uniref:TonB-dependent siderophore receptor n=1 Tax=Pseudomonas TaxID=286 RepID=UPI0008791FAD|nr:MULTISPECIES: TonB-dependent siderophore receptor [Pseudomonas]AOX09802.1 ligand-gated channel protein [Pseudomonas putida JB]MCI1024730.1 TonB-dependent siderophore receptor [Pseudomonas putida]MDN4511630.1 TonB-dependent siderophore receptor [Pseudomonas sp. 2,4-D]HBK51274.1 TonB-dependent siderophore receptor [Pseudomonas sp.]